MENSQGSSSQKRIEVNDKWVKVRVTTDSGAAGHVMIEGMFPLVKLERKTAKKSVAANGIQIIDLTMPCKTHEEIYRCITFRIASVRTFEILEVEQ